MGTYRFALSAIGLAVSGVMFAGSGGVENEIDFDVPAATAIERLDLANRTVDGTGMGSLTLWGDRGYTTNAVKVAVQRAGSPAIYCGVTIDPDSDTKSRATIDCSQKQVANTSASNETMRELGEEALTFVVAEHVKASVLARDYDVDRVADQMIAFMARSAPVMVATIQPPGDEEKPTP